MVRFKVIILLNRRGAVDDTRLFRVAFTCP